MIIVIGEILFDIYPKSRRLGGAPFNFAFHMKQLGFPVRFISRVGADDYGREILNRIQAVGFDRDDIQLDHKHPTGTVQVDLDGHSVPSFTVVPHVAYDFIEYFPQIHSELLKKARLLYFGTLVQRTRRGFQALHQFLNREPPGCKLLYDINLRPYCYSDNVVETSLRKTSVLKLNSEELQECRRITGISGTGTSFIRQMMSEYALEIVALTNGDQGSELLTPRGTDRYTPEPRETVVDTVGAGDAYAAMLAVGLLKNWPPKRTVLMATSLASRVCGIEGAIPKSAQFYEPIRKLMRIGE
jgi:fructokinase